MAFARLLLEHGADATVQANNGYTALHWLAQNLPKKDKKVAALNFARLLLEYGADATMLTGSGVDSELLVAFGHSQAIERSFLVLICP